MDSNLDLNKEWNKFLVECWMRNKGIQMHLVINQFNLIHNTEVEKSDFKTVPKQVFQYNYDVFRYVAENFPKINDFLLNTKKTDEVRIAKIAEVLSNTPPHVKIKTNKFAKIAKAETETKQSSNKLNNL